ncbi:MAG: zinc ribbon domain-containing protein, partial [Bacillota bacterium]|nr:zinc ribbon domain-containing protein [Bacillota bacterium]
MSLVPFTRNYEDNSTEAGFQFTFYCDLCNNGYKTNFTESNTHKKTGFLKGIGQAINLGASILGKHNVGWNVERGADIISQRFEGMS